jgi:hypothetical protein
MEKKYTLEQFMKALSQVTLVDPYHMTMVSNGYGEFPDGFKLTEIGSERLTEKLKEIL